MQNIPEPTPNNHSNDKDQTSSDVQETSNNVTDNQQISGLAVTSLVLGILDIIITPIAIVESNADNSSVLGNLLILAFIIAILATLFGVIADRQKGTSKRSTIVSSIGLILGGLELALSFIALAGFGILSCAGTA